VISAKSPLNSLPMTYATSMSLNHCCCDGIKPSLKLIANGEPAPPDRLAPEWRLGSCILEVSDTLLPENPGIAHTEQLAHDQMSLTTHGPGAFKNAKFRGPNLARVPNSPTLQTKSLCDWLPSSKIPQPSIVARIILCLFVSAPATRRAAVVRFLCHSFVVFFGLSLQSSLSVF